MKPQEVFPVVVGSGRSGTTLLRTILDAHPDLAMAHEPQFMGSVVRQARRFAGVPFPTADFIDTIYRNPNFRRLELDRASVTEALEGSPPDGLAEAVRSVFSLYADQQDKRWYGDKTPGYVIQIPELAALFPEIRFIHMIRDGRNVALSYVERPFGPSTIAEGALYWRSRVDRGRTAGAALGPERYTEVRYEDLVAHPEREVKRLCGFLSLEWNADMLRYHENAASFIAKSHEPDAFRGVAKPPTTGMRTWADLMTEGDIALFEAIAGSLLRDLGYEVQTERTDWRTRAAALTEKAKWASRRVRAVTIGRLRG